MYLITYFYFYFILKKKEVQGEKINGSQEYMDAYRLLVSAPVKEMFDTYMERVHSRGELGVLSSLNQRVWREYNDLKIYLENKRKEKTVKENFDLKSKTTTNEESKTETNVTKHPTETKAPVKTKKPSVKKEKKQEKEDDDFFVIEE